MNVAGTIITFILGWIGGAIGTLKFLRWYGRNLRKMMKEENQK